MHRTKVALIGYGYWGKNIAKTIAEVRDFELIAIIDRDKNALNQAQRTVTSCSHFSESIESCDNFDLVDAVIVAVPVSKHFHIVKDCLLKNKHILCEKVLSEKSNEVEELKSLAIEKNLTLDVGYTFLHHSSVHYIKKQLEDKVLGRLLYLTLKRTNYGPIRKDVNVITDLSVHDLSMCLYWLGMPEWISVISNQIEKNRMLDYAFIQMEYHSGVIIEIICSWLTPVKQRKIEIVGANGIIVFDDLEMDKLKIVLPDVTKLSEDGTTQLLFQNEDIFTPDLEQTLPLLNQIQSFYKNIKNITKDYTLLEYSLSIAVILEKIEYSVLHQGKRVYF